MTFKYFDKPDLFVGLRDTQSGCDTCGQNKLCFDAEGFYGSTNLTSICPECLTSGQLTNIDATTCEGDIKNLIDQLKQLNPNLTNRKIQEIAKEKTTELEKTTPNLITWQDWSWPCSHGDYCKFIGYGSKPFYKELAKHNSVEDFFKNSFYDPDLYNDDLWTESVPEEEIRSYGDSSQYGTLFYVFKSLHSDRIVTIWDCG